MGVGLADVRQRLRLAFAGPPNAGQRFGVFFDVLSQHGQ